MNPKNISAYAQQLYLFAEGGIEQAKLDGAQYWYIDGSLVEEYPHNWSEERIASLAHKIIQYNIKPIFHGNFKLPLSSDVPEIRNMAIQQIFLEMDLAKKLMAPLIIHGGAIVEPRLVVKTKKKALSHYLYSLEAIVDYANKIGVEVLLENLSNYQHYRPFHYIFTTPEEYQYIFDRIDASHVRFFFDVGHGAIGNGDPASVIHHFHDRIWGMSFSNNDGNRDLHLGIYQGVINYQKIITTILETQWRGVIAFEVRGRSFQRNVKDVTQLFQQATCDVCA